jgi:hypothetical protein
MKNLYCKKGPKLYAKNTTIKGGGIMQVYDPIKATFTTAMHRINGLKRQLLGGAMSPSLPACPEIDISAPIEMNHATEGVQVPNLKVKPLRVRPLKGKSIEGTVKNIANKSKTIALDIAKVLKGGTLSALN